MSRDARFVADFGTWRTLRPSTLCPLVLQRITSRLLRRVFLLACRADRHQLIQGRHRVPRADFAGVFLVVVEVLRRPGRGSRSRAAGRTAIWAGLNSIWIFTSLAMVIVLPVSCSTSTLRAFADAVDVGVQAVAVVGQLFHLGVFEVPLAEAEDGEEHAARRLSS